MGIIGSQIKPFKANAFQAGKDFFEVTQDDIAGKWAVFFFYPADFTFVCPTELEDLGEHYDMLQKMGVEVYGVSTDTHFAHKAWHDTSERIGKLKFAFLGDQLHTLSKNFDVLREDMGLADRLSFLSVIFCLSHNSIIFRPWIVPRSPPTCLQIDLRSTLNRSEAGRICMHGYPLMDIPSPAWLAQLTWQGHQGAVADGKKTNNGFSISRMHFNQTQLPSVQQQVTEGS